MKKILIGLMIVLGVVAVQAQAGTYTMKCPSVSSITITAEDDVRYIWKGHMEATGGPAPVLVGEVTDDGKGAQQIAMAFFESQHVAACGYHATHARHHFAFLGAQTPSNCHLNRVDQSGVGKYGKLDVCMLSAGECHLECAI